MKICMLIIFGSILYSCGKTKLDSSSNALSGQATYTCSQVASCVSACGPNPASSCVSGGGDRWSCATLDTSSYTNCLNRKVQIINGTIVTVGQ